MNEIDIQIEWQDGSGESLEIGYFNPNGQQCCGHCGVQGTMGSMHIKPNVIFVAMCMEQMGPTCMKDDAPSAKGVLRGYSTGRRPLANCIRFH